MANSILKHILSLHNPVTFFSFPNSADTVHFASGILTDIMMIFHDQLEFVASPFTVT